MNLQKIRYVVMALLLVAALALLFCLYLGVSYKVLEYRAGKNMAGLKESYIPLRFLVLSKSDVTVSGRCFLYNGDNREIASFERSWNGHEVCLETVTVAMGGRFFTFPARLSAGTTFARSGTFLFNYYNLDGFPGVFDSVLMDKKTTEVLKTLFYYVRTFGFYQKKYFTLREFEVGVIYQMQALADGTVRFLPE